jgi:hypothetical protein
MEENSADRNVEIWKIKKLIKSLELARGFVLFQIVVYLQYFVNQAILFIVVMVLA